MYIYVSQNVLICSAHH